MTRRDLIRAALGIAAGAAIPVTIVEAIQSVTPEKTTDIIDDKTRFLLCKEPVEFILEEKIIKSKWKRTDSIYTRLFRGRLEGDQFIPIAAVVWNHADVHTEHVSKLGQGKPIPIIGGTESKTPEGFLIWPGELASIMDA